MIDFKVLVKVNPENPYQAIQLLGLKVTGNAQAFATVDKIWAAKQDYLTALPVEVALTVEMREVVQANSPETKFIVTGVTAKNVKALKEDFGYAVYCSVPENDTPELKREHLTVKEDPAPVEHIKKYWYNGREISEREWDEKKIEFEKNWREIWKDLESPLKKMATLFD